VKGVLITGASGELATHLRLSDLPPFDAEPCAAAEEEGGGES